MFEFYQKHEISLAIHELVCDICGWKGPAKAEAPEGRDNDPLIQWYKCSWCGNINNKGSYLPNIPDELKNPHRMYAFLESSRESDLGKLGERHTHNAENIARIYKSYNNLMEIPTHHFSGLDKHAELFNEGFEKSKLQLEKQLWLWLYGEYSKVVSARIRREYVAQTIKALVPEKFRNNLVFLRTGEEGWNFEVDLPSPEDVGILDFGDGIVVMVVLRQDDNHSSPVTMKLHYLYPDVVIQGGFDYFEDAYTDILAGRNPGSIKRISRPVMEFSMSVSNNPFNSLGMAVFQATAARIRYLRVNAKYDEALEHCKKVALEDRLMVGDMEGEPYDD